MIRRLFELTEEHHSSLWFIAGICFLLFLWTAFMCYLPLWITVGQTGLSIISALGAGLMVGAAFTVVIPESISDALSHMKEGSGSDIDAYRLIGICVTVGFGCMMMADVCTHKCCGHSHSHGHGHSHEHEHGEHCEHEHGEHGEHGEHCEHCDHCEHEHEHEHEHDEHAEANAEAVDITDPLVKEQEHKKRIQEVNSRHSYQATVWGLCFHSIFDGVAIGASLLSKDARALWIILLAIVLHKSAASFGLGAYFKKLTLTVCESTPYVMLFASTTPVATFLMALIVYWGSSLNDGLLPVAFAFSAGTFLYVSITHIVPEIGSNLKAWHLLAMLVGILIPYFCFIDADSVYYCLLKKIMINKNEISNHSSTIRLSYLSFILLYHRNEKK